MKKFVLLSLLVGLVPVCAFAQDDMYFSPKKDKAQRQAQVKNEDIPAYYSGSDRSVDEYNRHGFGSRYQAIGGDSVASDVIDFYGNTPDSAYTGKKGKLKKRRYDYDDDDYDYAYSRRMRYFDDFFWYDDPWLYGYPYYGYYGWGRPWRYGYYGYAGWYAPWYYDSWYGGWYDPWYWGWNRPYYWGGAVAYRPYNRGGVTGTANHGWVDNGRRGSATGFSGYRGSTSTSSRNTDAYNRQNRTDGFSGYRGSRDNNSAYRTTERVNRTDNFNRNDAFQQSGYRNESTFNNSGSFNRSGSSSFGGGGFSGGSRGGGFSGGGGRSGGGGHFGGRR